MPCFWRTTAMKTVSLLCLVVAATVCFSGPANAQGKVNDAKKVALAKQALGQAKVTFAEALAAAQNKGPDGKPLIARVEIMQESNRIGFYFLDGGKVQEVEVDARTGEVLKSEEKKDPEKDKKFADALKAVKGSKVTFQEAMEIGAGR